jgi:hypothetical protein
MNMPETFALQAPQGTVELASLIPNDVVSEIPVRPASVPLSANPLGHIQNERDWNAMELARELHEGFPRLHLHIRRIHHREPPGLQPLCGDEPQDLECSAGRCLIVLVVRHESAAVVRRQDLRRQKMPARKRRLPGP